MLINKTNLDIWYKDYLEQRRKTEKYIKSRGGTVRREAEGGVDISTRADFETDFRSMAEDDKKSSGKQLAQKMAKQELFQNSWKQSESMSKAYEERFGMVLSFKEKMELRMGITSAATNDLSADIKIRTKELSDEADRDKSWRSKYATKKEYLAIMIGQEFFGSPT